MSIDEKPATPSEAIPEFQPAQTSANIVTAPVKKQSLVLPIALMAGPTIAIVVSIFLYALISLFLGGDSLTGFSPLRAILNTLIFIVGAVSVMAGFPCFVIGLIFLIQRLSKK